MAYLKLRYSAIDLKPEKLEEATEGDRVGTTDADLLNSVALPY
jgi:hypothetical protein